MKKKQILTLIENELLTTKLVYTFKSIGIDANHYLTDTSKVVFKLMGIKKEHRTEALYRNYFELIKQVEYLDLRNDLEKSRLSLKIYHHLFTAVP
jgi:hypothetical protein